VGSSFSLSEVFLRTQTDERLCALAADGHAKAFTVLVQRHRGALLHTAGKVVGTQRAEDVVQEALLRAFRALAAGTRVAHFQAWLHQIVRNTAVNQLAGDLAQTGPLPADLADRASVGETFDDRLIAHDVLAQIAALPERQRTALVKTELQGRSRRDIAADLGLTEGAVRQLVHRARRAVRVAMTAVTPYPLAAWVAHRGAGPGTVEAFARIAPPPGSARTGVFEGLVVGSTAGGGALLKGSATVIAVSALGGGLAWRTLTGAHSRHQMAHHQPIAATARRAAPAAPTRATPAMIKRQPAAAVAVAAVTWDHAPNAKARSGDSGDHEGRRNRSNGNDTPPERASSTAAATVSSTDGRDEAGDGSWTSALGAAATTPSGHGETSNNDGSDSSPDRSVGSSKQRTTDGSVTSTSSSTLTGTSNGSLPDSSGSSSANTADQAPAATPGD
jgi:RNA polymerase sigma factor (sigma-70 family)